MSRRRHGARRAVFLQPAAIAVATLVGLVAGLLGDGVYDGLAWAGLGIPVAVIVAVVARHRAAMKQRPSDRAG